MANDKINPIYKSLRWPPIFDVAFAGNGVNEQFKISAKFSAVPNAEANPRENCENGDTKPRKVHHNQRSNG